MSFELTNALAIMQRIINKALQLFLNQFVIIYMNDIFIYFETKAEYRIQVNKIFKTLRTAKFRVKMKKSIFHTQEVDFFEYVITLEKVAMEREKLDTIVIWFEITYNMAI